MALILFSPHFLPTGSGSVNPKFITFAESSESRKAEYKTSGCAHVNESGKTALNDPSSLPRWRIGIAAQVGIISGLVFGLALGLSGCTASVGAGGPASLGVGPTAQIDLSQNPGVSTDTITGNTVAVGPIDPASETVSAQQVLAAQQDQLASTIAAAEGPSFVPGSLPPGQTVTSTEYVTDGVVRTVATPASPAPLTPGDLQAQGVAAAATPDVAAASNQVPAPSANQPDAPAGVQVASLSAAAAAPEAAQSPATATAEPVATAPVVAPKTARAAMKPTLFGALFGNKTEATEPEAAPASDGQTAAPAAIEETAEPAAKRISPEVKLVSLSQQSNDDGDQQSSALPGVNSKNIFGIESLDEPFDDGPEDVQVASATAAGLARLAPNGILKQTDRVEVACFKPELLTVLARIEKHYGKKLVVTSGYRSPKGNRRAGGSRNSQHIYCKAADIQVPGISKWHLAKFLRTLPGRGGVGTYCHTDSVHIDVGPRRDWNWRCRKR